MEKCVNEVITDAYGGGVELLCQGGGLPQTGLDIVFLAVGGVILFVVGLMLRRSTRQVT